MLNFSNQQMFHANSSPFRMTATRTKINHLGTVGKDGKRIKAISFYQTKTRGRNAKKVNRGKN